MHEFALGALYALPSGTNPTPVPIAVLSDITVDLKQTVKYLNGQFPVPIDAGKGPLEISIKIKNADFRAATMGLLLPPAATTVTPASTVLPVTGEAQTIPGTPYQVTVTQSATWVEDGGVLDLTTGLWKTRVASGPATGQYSVAAGVYTFAAADTTHNLSIVYAYSSTTSGVTLNYQNQTMGFSTGYGLRTYNLGRSAAGLLQPMGIKFYNVHFDNLSFALKAEDFGMQDLSGRAIQDTASLNVFNWYVGE